MIPSNPLTERHRTVKITVTLEVLARPMEQSKLAAMANDACCELGSRIGAMSTIAVVKSGVDVTVPDPLPQLSQTN